MLRTAESSTAFTATRGPYQRPFPQGRTSTPQTQHRSSGSSTRSSPNSGTQHASPHFVSSSSDARRNLARPTGTQAPRPRPSCQICGKLGHVAIDCYHRIDRGQVGRHPPARLAAMVAAHSHPHHCPSLLF